MSSASVVTVKEISSASAFASEPASAFASEPASAEDKECSICAEPYNAKQNKPIQCEYCPMKACRSCCQRYILGENTITCMDRTCNRGWSRKYIASQFTQSFIDGPLKDHRKTILYDKERAKFEYTIEKMNQLEDIESKILKFKNKSAKSYNACNKVSEKYFKHKDYHKAVTTLAKLERCREKCGEDGYIMNDYFNRNIPHFNSRILTTSKEIKDSYSNEKMKELDESYKVLKTKSDTDNDKLTRARTNKHNIWQEIEGGGNVNRAVRNKPKNIQKCPTIDCNGILNAEWHCILCKVTACSSCHEPVDEEHKCNPDTIETIKMLKTDTKSCPKCYTNIYKIDGCDQMWCTQCHTAFSWKTGNVETKIHNPHYYEWMRKKSASGVIPREMGDNQACEAINNNAAVFYTEEIRKYNIDETVNQDIVLITDDFMKNVQGLVHLTEVVLPRYRVVDDLRKEYIERCEFLKKHKSEKEFKMCLEKEAKKKNKNTEVQQLIQLWIDAKTDILRRIMDVIRKTSVQPINLENVIISLNSQKKIMNEMIDLDAYVHSSAKEIENTYKNIVKLH